MPHWMQALLAGLVWTVTAPVLAAPVGATAPGSIERVQPQTSEASRRSPEQPPQIELIVVPPAAGMRALEHTVSSLGQRLAGWFRPIGVATACRSSPVVDPQALLEPSDQVGIRVWLLLGNAADRHEGATAHLYFVVERSPKQAPKFLWRSVELMRGLDEIGAELLIQVVHLSSLALWEGSIETPREQLTENLESESGAVVLRAPMAPAALGSGQLPEGRAVPNPPVTAPSQTPPPMAPSAGVIRITYRAVTQQYAHPPGSWLASLGIGYAVRWRGPEHAAAGPEMTLGANLWFETDAFGIRAAWQALSTQVVALERATFETNGNALRLGARYTRDQPRELALAAELGTGLDIIRYRATLVQDPQSDVPIEPHDLRPFIYLELGLQRRVGPLGLGVAGLLAGQLRRTRYGVLTDGRYDAMLTPWRLQPGLRLELSWQ